MTKRAKTSCLMPWCLMISGHFKRTRELRLSPRVPTLASHGLFIALGLELQRQQTSESLYSHQSSLSLWTLYDLPLCSGRLAGSAHSGISIFTLKRQNVLFFFYSSVGSLFLRWLLKLLTESWKEEKRRRQGETECRRKAKRSGSLHVLWMAL